MLSSQSPSQRVADPAAFASAVPAGGAAGLATFLLSAPVRGDPDQSVTLTDALQIVCLGDLVVVKQIFHDKQIHVLLGSALSVMRAD
jgi:hypothetical protein